MDGYLSLSVTQKNGKSYLASSRFRVPLQITRPFYLDDSGSACLFLINPCGGLVGGDSLRVHVDVEEGAHLLLTTQSATKVYKTLGPPAIQRIVFSLKEGAILEFLPDHVIPFAGSSFHQEIEVNMEKGSVAFIVDSFASGRKARQERFQFHQYRNTFVARYLGRTFLLERVVLTQTGFSFSEIGLMEDNDYLASFYLLGDSVGSHEGVSRVIDSELRGCEGVSGSSCSLSERGVLIRILSDRVFAMNDAIQKVWSLARHHLLGAQAFSLRKY